MLIAKKFWALYIITLHIGQHNTLCKNALIKFSLLTCEYSVVLKAAMLELHSFPENIRFICNNII